MSCLIKGFSVIINVLVSVIGLFLITGSSIVIALTHGNAYQLDEFDFQLLYWKAVALAVIGAFMFTLGLLGCFSAHRQKRSLFTGYSILMGIMICVCIYYVVNLNKEDENIVERMKTHIDTIYTDLNKNQKVAIFLQEALTCCGANNFTDWKSAKDAFPPNCCKHKSDQSCKYIEGLEKLPGNAVEAQYYGGCKAAAEPKIREIMFSLLIIVIVTIMVQFIALLTTLFLCCAAHD